MQPSLDHADVGTSEVLTAELPSVRLVWSLRVICAAALVISVYLAWTAFSMGNVYGCSGGDIIDCEHILTSHWSKIMGIPVSVPAAGLYASLIALLAFARKSGPASLRQLVWGGMTLGSVMAGLAAFWFIGLQVSEMKFCPYCLAVHSCGMILAGSMLATRFCNTGLKVKSIAVSVLGVATLIVIQGSTPKSDQFEVVHYDELPTAASNEGTIIGPNDLGVFEAPGDVTEAPGDASAATIEVFEAPTFDDGPPDSNAVGVRSTEVHESGEPVDSKANDEQPSVAATLLLVIPPQVMHLGNLLLALPDSSEESNETPATSSEEEAATPKESTDKSEANSDNPTTAETKASDATAVDSTQEPKKEAPKPPERRLLTFAGNRFTLDIKQWPLLGKTDAKFVFVEMFDYTCPHCRNTHQAVAGARKQYGDDLAIFALPVPLENACNPAAAGGGHPGACEMAKIAIAVWRLDPEKFQTFHDWMFQGHRTATTARQFAETLVDKERLKAELSSDVPGKYISRHVSLYQRVGSGQVPKLIFPATTMQGEINSTTTLCNAIERELAVVRK